MLVAKLGSARRIASFAPQASRVRIGGEPAIDGRRSGIRSSGLRMKYARNRSTCPRSRYAIRSDGPVQNGLPSRHPRVRRFSELCTSGRSSLSGAAWCQALQRPSSERVRNCTEPGPLQCSPTRSNSEGAAAARVRSPCSGTSRTVIDTPPSAAAGAARNARTARTADLMGDGTPAKGACRRLRPQGLRPSLRKAFPDSYNRCIYDPVVPAWLIWAIAAVLLSVGELLTPGMFFLGPVALAAVAATIVAITGVGVVAQLNVVIAASAATVLLLRRVAR